MTRFRGFRVSVAIFLCCGSVGRPCLELKVSLKCYCLRLCESALKDQPDTIDHGSATPPNVHVLFPLESSFVPSSLLHMQSSVCLQVLWPGAASV